jgi:glucose/arabinose dehydrogenase
VWPAHAAPLHFLAVPISNPGPWAGQLLVAWHGHRATGQRVMSLKLDARGRPVGRPMEVLGGWDAVAGVRPKGAPTGLAVDRAGRLWVVEDRNKTVLMVRTE